MLVEIMSGQRFDEYLATRIFDPLGMTDTGFSVRPESADRLAACYALVPGNPLALADDPATSAYREPPSFLSGGGGLAGTAADCVRAAKEVAAAGAELILFAALSDQREQMERLAAEVLPELA